LHSIKLDIKGFTYSLRKFRFKAFEDVLLRHILVPLTHVISKTYRLKSQHEMFNKILNEDQFLLIILDACRYDVFAHVYKRYFQGILVPVKSYGAFLPEWIPKLFRDPRWHGTRIFKAKLFIKPHDISIRDMIERRDIEIFEISPPKERLTVHPQMLVNFVLKIGLKDKNIVWFMQPHYPWLAYPELSKKVLKDIMIYEFLPGSLEKNLLSKKIHREDIIKAYIANLTVTLREVKRLIEVYRETFKDSGIIVVTSDHGEMLGEYGLYFHHPSYNVPQLIVVPWLEVTNMS